MSSSKDPSGNPVRCIHCWGIFAPTASSKAFCSDRCRVERKAALERIRYATRPSNPKARPWDALMVRELAVKECRPIITRVSEGMWVMYPPIEGEPVRGGYAGATPHDALETAVPIAKSRWGALPFAVETILAEPSERSL